MDFMSGGGLMRENTYFGIYYVDLSLRVRDFWVDASHRPHLNSS